MGLSQPLVFMSELALTDEGVRKFSDGAIINTDDNLHLEFSSPLAVGEYAYAEAILQEIYEIGPGQSPLAGSEEEQAALANLQNLKRASIAIETELRSNQPSRISPAEKRLREITENAPAYWPAVFLLSDHLMLRSDNLLRNGRVQAAATAAQEAVVLMPRNAEARLILATALIRLGRLEPAIIQLEQARKELPRHWMIPYRLSEALMRAGRADESLEALESAAEIHPSNPEIQARLRSMKSRLSGPQ